MKKKLLFPNVDYKGLQKANYITISKNKVVDYTGIYPIVIFDLSEVRDNGNVYLNSIYKLRKIDKHDKRSFGVKGTHIITCEALKEYVHSLCFVKLNIFERTYTNWHLKKYLIQDLDVKKSTLSGFIGVILGIILTKIFG